MHQTVIDGRVVRYSKIPPGFSVLYRGIEDYLGKSEKMHRLVQSRFFSGFNGLITKAVPTREQHIIDEMTIERMERGAPKYWVLSDLDPDGPIINYYTSACEVILWKNGWKIRGFLEEPCAYANGTYLVTNSSKVGDVVKVAFSHCPGEKNTVEISRMRNYSLEGRLAEESRAVEWQRCSASREHHFM